MAARKRFSVEDMLEQVLEEKGSDVDSEEELDLQVDLQKEKMEEWVESFDGGECCDHEFFRENVTQAVLCIVPQSFLTKEPAGGKILYFLSCFKNTMTNILSAYKTHLKKKR